MLECGPQANRAPLQDTRRVFIPPIETTHIASLGTLLLLMVALPVVRVPLFVGIIGAGGIEIALDPALSRLRWRLAQRHSSP